MQVERIDHVQIAIPPNGEDQSRAFYGQILGFEEIPKPDELVARGGAWFKSGDVNLHLGVDPNFGPARKAHIAFIVKDVGAIVAACRAGSYEVGDDDPLEGYDRAYIYDPFGNRLEIMRPLG